MNAFDRKPTRDTRAPSEKTGERRQRSNAYSCACTLFSIMSCAHLKMAHVFRQDYEDCMEVCQDSHEHQCRSTCSNAAAVHGTERGKIYNVPFRAPCLHEHAKSNTHSDMSWAATDALRTRSTHGKWIAANHPAGIASEDEPSPISSLAATFREKGAGHNTRPATTALAAALAAAIHPQDPTTKHKPQAKLARYEHPYMNESHLSSGHSFKSTLTPLAATSPLSTAKSKWLDHPQKSAHAALAAVYASNTHHAQIPQSRANLSG